MRMETGAEDWRDARMMQTHTQEALVLPFGGWDERESTKP